MPLAGHEVRLCPGIAVNLDPLSQRETEALDKAFEELRGLTVGQIIEKLHRECPEWSCPGESSQTIDPKAILSQVMKDSEAEEVWSELAKSQNARLTFSVR